MPQVKTVVGANRELSLTIVWAGQNRALVMWSAGLQPRFPRGTSVRGERQWMMETSSVDLTSRSLRKVLRRGTLVVPADAKGSIQSDKEVPPG